MEEKAIEELFNSFGLPVQKAETILRGCIDAEVRTKDILSELHIIDNPKGNKLWEIELLLKGPQNKGEYAVGFFACHRSKGFITYSITLNREEYWFDRYQAALEFLGFEFETSALSN